MKKDRNVKKKQRINILFGIQIGEFILAAIGLYILDCFLKIDIIFNLSRITDIMLNSTLTVLGLWISCYFLAIQIYKNKYPMDLIKNRLKSLYIKFIVSMAICFSVGIVYLFIGPHIISTIAYSINCVFCIGLILYYAYKTVDDYSINKLFSEYIIEINNELSNDDKTSKGMVADNFGRLEKLYVEAYRDKNYYICENIIQEASDSFRKLISMSSKMLLSDKSDNKSETISLANTYIKFNIREINKAKESEDKSFYNRLLSIQRNNLYYCLEARQFKIFEDYIENLIALVYIFNEDNYEIERILDIIFDVGEKIIVDNIDEKYLESIYSYLNDVIKAKNFERIDTNITSYYKLMMHLLTVSSDNDTKFYVTTLVNIKKNIVYLSMINKNFENTFFAFLNYANHLIDNEKKYSFIDEYLELYSIIEKFTYTDVRWINYHFALLSEVENKYPDKEMDICKIRNDMIHSIISKSVSVNKVLLPEIGFKKIIESYGLSDQLEETIKDFIEIIRISMIKDNSYVIYEYITEFNECISSISKDKKDLQKKLLGIYCILIMCSVDLAKKSIIALIFDKFIDVIRDLDKEKQLSNSLTNYILDELLNLALDNFNKSEFLVSKIIETFHDFVKEDSIVYFAVDKEHLIIKKIYNIGLISIENNNESILRQVSNSIGWIILKAIDKKKTMVYDYGIKRAIDLYELSKYMKVSTKTMIFIMTLFTTIGTYCQAEKNLFIVRKRIIDAIIKEDKGVVETAISLRTHENNMWDELLKKPEYYGQEFLKAFMKEKEARAKKNKTAKKKK